MPAERQVFSKSTHCGKTIAGHGKHPEQKQIGATAPTVQRRTLKSSPTFRPSAGNLGKPQMMSIGGDSASTAVSVTAQGPNQLVFDIRVHTVPKDESPFPHFGISRSAPSRLKEQKLSDGNSML